jgi:hypothetical protein
MTKLVYGMTMSLDGYIAGPENGHGLLALSSGILVLKKSPPKVYPQRTVV